MPRKKLVCALPPPRRPRGRRAPDDRQLLEILRRLALTHQRSEPQLFYPLRDAARELGVSLSAISRAYEALKKEGILGTIRASRTVIEGRDVAHQVSFKGFIGLPLSLSCFLVLQDYRSFYFALRRESHRRGFVSNLLFYNDDRSGREELGEMLAEFGVQYVIWYLPRNSAVQTVLRLRDRGVRVVGVADGTVSSSIFCKYEIRRERGLVAILQRWREADGIRHVTIIRSHSASPADEETLAHAIETAEFSYDSIWIDAERSAESISSLGGKRRQGIVLLGKAAAIVSLSAPSALGELLGRCRVTLLDGPTTAISGAVPVGRVDVLAVNWQIIARVIVRDLETKRAFEQTKPVIFEAVPRFGIPIGESAGKL